MTTALEYLRTSAARVILLMALMLAALAPTSAVAQDTTEILGEDRFDPIGDGIGAGDRGVWLTGSGGRNLWVPYGTDLSEQEIRDALTNVGCAPRPLALGDPRSWFSAYNPGLIWNQVLNCDVIDDVPYEAISDPDHPENPVGETADVYIGEEPTFAEMLLFYAMGGENNSCLSCDVLAYFMIGLSSFSKTIAVYFTTAFSVVAPVMMAIWIGYRVARLMVGGGEDGKAFIMSVVQKFSLFTVIWIVTTTTLGSAMGPGGVINTNRPMLWDWVGPTYLDFAFDLSGSVRNFAISEAASDTGGVSDVGRGGSTPFGCGGVETTGGSLQTIAGTINEMAFMQSAMEVGCVTERIHMVGISSGIAMIYSAANGQTTDDGSFTARAAKAILLGLVKIGAGTMMLTVFVLSAVWLIFLILDIVVRGMITAAFSPVLALLYLWQPTRSIASGAIRGLGGALVTAVAISIVTILAYFLLTQVVDIYNALQPMVAAAATGADAANIQQVTEPTRAREFSTFVARIQETDPEKPYIPMDLSTPYFYYMCLAGITVFSLGKKIIAMLEGMVGSQGFSAMADNAMSMTRTAAGFGMAATGIAAVGARVVAGGATGGIGMAAGAVKNGLGGTKNPMAGGGGGGPMDSISN
jgi:hypothetical protein